MTDPDPAQATSPEDLARCLRHLRLRADNPAFRLMEQRTRHVSGLFPGTTVGRVPLRRSTISEVLGNEKFPRKGFFLTFVELCGIDLATDRRWEEAWDRVASRIQEEKSEAFTTQLPAQPNYLSEQFAAERRARVELAKEVEVLRQQLRGDRKSVV